MPCHYGGRKAAIFHQADTKIGHKEVFIEEFFFISDVREYTLIWSLLRVGA